MFVFIYLVSSKNFSGQTSIFLNTASRFNSPEANPSFGALVKALAKAFVTMVYIFCSLFLLNIDDFCFRRNFIKS